MIYKICKGKEDNYKTIRYLGILNRGVINAKNPAVFVLGFNNVAATYSPGCNPSTIGAAGLNFSVRDGKRWDPCARPPKSLWHTPLNMVSSVGSHSSVTRHLSSNLTTCLCRNCNNTRVSFWAISTTRLWHCCLYTYSLSTSSSLTALYGSLILRGVSHLDAFSAYLSPT